MRTLGIRTIDYARVLADLIGWGSKESSSLSSSIVDILGYAARSQMRPAVLDGMERPASGAGVWAEDGLSS